MALSTFIFTVWIWPAPETGRPSCVRKVMRLQGLTEQAVREYVTTQCRTSYGSEAVVEFGPFSVSTDRA